MQGSLRTWLLASFVITFWAAIASPGISRGDYDSALNSYLNGKYENALEEIEEQFGNEFNPELNIRLYLLRFDVLERLGRDSELLQGLQTAIAENPTNISLRWRLLQKVQFDEGGFAKRSVDAELRQIIRFTSTRVSMLDSDVIAVAEYSLAQGADPKQVQDVFFKLAQTRFPESRVVPLAVGNLALSKRDFDLAARTFRGALEDRPDDTDLLFGLAQALEEGHPVEFTDTLKLVLEKNPRHTGALIKLAGNQITAEDYAEAIQSLDKIFEFNPTESQALATRAAIDLLRHDEEDFELHYAAAFSSWSDKTRVDHTIGKLLSRKYLFKEGAEFQQRALARTPSDLASKKQLAFDLLRLGADEEGWRLANEVSAADEYDVSTYNLVQLEQELRNYTVLTPPGWRIRMHHHEAEVYGDEVIALLQEARQVLCEKYAVDLDHEIVVEIFHRPNDFAVRTFGLPGAGGYLGVCFGNVVTAVSPEANPHLPMNWRSVIWHEFTHVVTLNKTHNRMPRWLSEGISVYEERQKNPRWRPAMSIGYRKLVLEGQAKSLDQISEAFSDPNSPGGVGFAYFQSYLAVDYLIEKYGLENLNLILDDLGMGLNFVEALERHTEPVALVNEGYQARIEQLAQAYGAGVEWKETDFQPILEADDPVVAALAFVDGNQRNYSGLMIAGAFLNDRGEKQQALRVYQQALKLFDQEIGDASPISKIASLHRELNEPEQELAALLKLVNQSESAPQALFRILELCETQNRWSDLKTAALQLLENRPMSARAYASVALAGENLAEPTLAIWALDRELKFKEFGRASQLYRLAKQYHAVDNLPQSRRHVLEALEETPRYVKALELLRDLQEEPKALTADPEVVPEVKTEVGTELLP